MAQVGTSISEHNIFVRGCHFLLFRLNLGLLEQVEEFLFSVIQHAVGFDVEVVFAAQAAEFGGTTASPIELVSFVVVGGDRLGIKSLEVVLDLEQEAIFHYRARIGTTMEMAAVFRVLVLLGGELSNLWMAYTIS